MKKSKVYFRTNGVACRYPPSKAAARKAHSKRYDSGSLCPVCSDNDETTYARFTANDECIHCMRLAALEAYADRIRAGSPDSPTEAIAQGLNHFYRPEMCSKAGHIGKRTLDGDCFQCTARKVKTPLIQDQCPDLIISRDGAKAVGFTVYRTGEACKKGHKGYRYISNRGCVDCKNEN